MALILIVEDDKELRQLFEHVLLRKGYVVYGVTNGKEALEFMDENHCDLIISDIMMPVMDGYELVKTIRARKNQVPILMITAKDAFNDMQMGFSSGTDDYMVKPVNVNEMVLRVEALLRRSSMVNERKLNIGDTIMDWDLFTVTTKNEKLILPQKEFMILYKMASYQGHIFTRQQLLDEVWGYSSDSDTHTVDVHIGRLREKFRNNQDFEIVTIRGLGYKVVKL